MKLQVLLLATVLATITALAAVAHADEKVAPPTEMKAEKAAPTHAMKPHSHVQEKTGVPPSEKPAAPARTNPASDKTKHYHPRDAK